MPVLRLQTAGGWEKILHMNTLSPGFLAIRMIPKIGVRIRIARAVRRHGNLGSSVAEKQENFNGLGAGMVLTTVTRIVDRMLAGLEYIHKLKIVHRDIKPINLLCALINQIWNLQAFSPWPAS
ncbi:hypothetical protein IW262DRAFT_1466165 [Armillaria fumosa]|nr:hypothetical protein IW262DRAFT_1466165 [Armillaria fumosa]